MAKMKLLMALVIGLILGALSLFALQQTPVFSTEKAEPAEKEILYWVAPMDDNYRRDQPGKSPMGMDLVPVYAEDNTSTTKEVGAVTIAPSVINNLGVTTATVESGLFQSPIHTVGYVKFDEDKLVHIHSRVSGWIDKLYVKSAGNAIKKGTPLYSLYSPELVNAQEDFLIALRRGNRSLVNASKDRLKSLYLSDKFIQRLQVNKKVQQTVTFYAPQTGVVDQLDIREGFFVKPDKTIMSIGQLDQVWVEAEIYERDFALIKEGLPVEMSVSALPGLSWSGQVDYIYPTLNPKTRTLRIRLKFKNANHQLKPNMFAHIELAPIQQDKALLVVKEAVIRTGQQDRVVLALGEGRFKSIAVTLGHIGSEFIEIRHGLKPGDRVVTSAQFLIDSESSKTTDFKRFSSKIMPSAMDESATNDYPSATVEGTIEAIDMENRVLNISRGAIEKWNRPAARLDFVADNKIEIAHFKEGDKIQFTFEVRDDLVVTDISPLGVMSQNADHSSHNMGEE